MSNFREMRFIIFFYQLRILMKYSRKLRILQPSLISQEKNSQFNNFQALSV